MNKHDSVPKVSPVRKIVDLMSPPLHSGGLPIVGEPTASTQSLAASGLSPCFKSKENFNKFMLLDQDS